VVYCGGLENRCGITPTGGSNPSPSAKIFVKEFYIKLLIAAVVIGTAFGIAWKQGLLERLATYMGETGDELKKCQWPTRPELVQYTALIFVTVAALGLFTVGADFILLHVVRYLLN